MLRVSGREGQKGTKGTEQNSQPSENNFIVLLNINLSNRLFFIILLLK